MSNLIAELNDTLKTGTPERRNDILRSITDLFVVQAEVLTDQQLQLFDDLLLNLVDAIESKAVAELSEKMSTIPAAPPGLIRKLSRSEDIAIAGPILGCSARLSDDDLVEIAAVKSQAHLSEIAGRSSVSEIVTDALINRGNAMVVNKVAANAGARFSDHGYDSLVSKASDDAELASTILGRTDLSPDLLHRLVAQATVAVQKKLALHADPAMRSAINEVLTRMSLQMAQAAKPNQRGPDESKMLRSQFSSAAESRNLVKCIELLASLLVIPNDSVKRLVREKQTDAILIACRAADLNWPDAQQFISLVTGRSCDDIKMLCVNYAEMQPAQAQRVIRFFKARKAISSDQIANLIAGNTPA